MKGTASTKRGGSIVGWILNFFRTLIQLDAVTRMLQLTKIPAAGFMLGFFTTYFAFSYILQLWCQERMSARTGSGRVLWSQQQIRL